jgi:hypothetical protein
MNCYPKAYLEKYEVVDESWRDKFVRDQKAKQLRREGYEKVECKKYDCDGVLVYTLCARKERA